MLGWMGRSMVRFLTIPVLFEYKTNIHFFGVGTSRGRGEVGGQVHCDASNFPYALGQIV